MLIFISLFVHLFHGNFAISMERFDDMNYIASRDSDCTIDLDKRPVKYQPFLLDSDNDILRPEGSRILTVGDGESVTLHCHNENIDTAGIPGFKLKVHYITIQCKDSKFYHGKAQVNPQKIGCTDKLYPVLTKTRKVCSPIGSDGRTTGLEKLYEIEVGFNFTGHYLLEIKICHDEREYATIWTQHSILGKSIEYRDKTPERPSFKVDIGRHKRFYFTSSSNMNKHYSKTTQVKSVFELLGTNYVTVRGKRVKIIDSGKSSSSYFAKGHLSPDAAFIYDAEQDATYFYFNAAPQYQAFNNRNWKSLETICRKYASFQGYDISIHTGTFDHLAYPNVKGQLTDIFIFPKDLYVPAPRYYWKVIHDQVINKAIAYVGLNDIHAEFPPSLLCTNRCDQTTLKDRDFSNLEEGYIYCCKVEELRRKLKSVPDLVNEYGEYPDFLTGEEE